MLQQIAINKTSLNISNTANPNIPIWTLIFDFLNKWMFEIMKLQSKYTILSSKMTKVHLINKKKQKKQRTSTYAVKCRKWIKVLQCAFLLKSKNQETRTTPKVSPETLNHCHPKYTVLLAFFHLHTCFLFFQLFFIFFCIFEFYE